MTFSRVALPTEFVDITSAMMLKQPEPAYFYAQLAFMAVARAELLQQGIAPQIGVAPDRSPSSQGAAPLDFKAQQLQLGSDPMAEAIFAVEELGKAGIGHTIRINRPAFSGGGYTEASRTINATTSISTTPIDVTNEQVSITVRRIVGPFASGGSVPQPYAIDKLDATRSIHSLAGLVGLHLCRDRWKYMDGVMSALIDSGANTIWPGGGTSDTGTFSASEPVGTHGMDLDTLFRAEQKAQELNLPRFANGRYAAILSPQQMRQLKQDPDYKGAAVFQPPLNPLSASYLSTIGTVDLYYSNTYVTDTATVSSVTIHHGNLIAPGCVGFGVAQPPRIASANEDNYGETAKVVWVAYEGVSVMDNRFIVNIHTD